MVGFLRVRPILALNLGLEYMMGVWRAVFTAIGILAASPAVAMSLKQAIVLARQSHPALLAAGANVTASYGRANQARSALLPQLSISAGTNRNWREYATRDSFIPLADDKYTSKTAQLNLSYAV
jgi:outer membrane protein TolC